jgi:hypothetical protein
VYFGDNRATARNLQVFLEVVSELLTLLTLGRIDPSCVVRAAAPAASAKRTSWTHLPVRVHDVHRRDGGDSNHASARFPPLALSAPSPLEDAIAGVCCAQARCLTLAAVLQAASMDAVYAAAFTQLRSFVQKTHSAVVSAAQLLEHVQTFTRHRGGGSPHAYPLLLCLFLSNLRFLFANNTALSLDLVVTLFPRITPWNVQTALFGSTSLSEDADGAQSEPALVQAHSTYYAYITRLMRSHADLCACDAAMVLSWLNFALQLDAENSEPADGVKCGVFATPSGKRKSSYLVTVRNILHPAGEYAVSLMDAMHVCAANQFPEGVLILCDRWLQTRQHRSSHTSLEQSGEVRRLLEEALGRLVSELVIFLHAQEDDTSSKKSAIPPSRSGSGHPHEDGSSPVLSHLCDLLAQCVRLLRCLNIPTATPTASVFPRRQSQAQREAAACEDVGRLLNLLLEGSLEGIAPTEEGESSEGYNRTEWMLRTQRRVAKVCGEVLLDALDVRGALAAAPHCAALMHLR